MGRSLRHELLEDRRVLTLLGVAPLGLPIVGFDSGGHVSYDSANDLLSIAATPLSSQTATDPSGFFFSGSVNVNIQVDNAGALVGGVASDDFILTGDVDLNGDFVVDQSGTLLTGEILAFGSEDSGGTTDKYDFRFSVTGGALAGMFAGEDIGLTLTSENSSFAGDFTVDFGGNAKGDIGAIEPLAPVVPSCIAYDSGGSIRYDSSTDALSLSATPLTTAAGGFFFSGAVDIDAIVDGSGTLVSGVPGDDFTLTGDLDANGDFMVDYSGTLLTGELISFSSTDSGGTTDTYEFHVSITGGALASQYAGYDLIVSTTSENSTFTGDFTVDFGGNAKGHICPEEQVALAGLSGHKYLDQTGDGLTADDTPLAGVTVSLYQDLGTVGVLDGQDVLVASTATDDGGQYQFDDLLPGDYLVAEEVPAGYAATTPTIYAVALAAGDNISTGLDFANRLLTPNIALKKLTNGEDADTEEEAPEIAPGDVVTWTYEVTNTGEVAFTEADVVITDDAGTPDDESDDFSTTSGDIVLVAGSDLGGDGILSPGETWTYEATGTAQDLFVLGAMSTLNFSGNSPLDGPNGNIRTFSVGSVSVHASAFGRDSSGNWSPAYLGQYSGGLGVTDNADGDGSNNAHTVDDVNSADYVLFEFSDTVVVDSAFLGYVVGDSDLTVWIGSTTDPFNNHLTLSDAVLADLGFTEVNLTNSSSTRWADFNAGQVSGNVLVIAAKSGDDGCPDKFKIQKLTFQKGDRSCYENYAVVTTGPNGPTASDASHYCNPTVVIEEKASVGNYFFIDSNDNGIQDAGDLGVNGVTVNLLDSGGSIIASAITANDDAGNAGYYLFYNLDAGNYFVEFVVPEGVHFTAKDAGDDALDSDVNANGRTDLIALGAGENLRNVDAGVSSTVCTEATVYKVEDYFTWCQNTKAGIIKGVTLEYNDTTEELYVEVTVAAYWGRVADGFTIVISDDSGYASCLNWDKYAIFYFDASQSGGPVLNVLGFNGRFDATSFRDSNGNLRTYDPDQIATSLDNSSGWVQNLSVVEHYNERIMSFRIDASGINDHVPMRGIDWQGAEIGRRASFSLDTYDRLRTRYDDSGFLTGWAYCYHGWMDACKIRTEKCIVQECVAIDSFFEQYGWEVSDFAGDSNGNVATDQTWEGSVDVAVASQDSGDGDSTSDGGCHGGCGSFDWGGCGWFFGWGCW